MFVIETKRLYLRAYRDADFDALHAIFSDPETMANYPAPFNTEQTQHWIDRNQARYKNDGFGLWAVCLKGTDELIGDCGLVKQTIDGEVDVEIGYHINKKYWFNGYASEAAAACKQYGFHNLGLKKMISIIDPRNVASIRVAEKMGLAKEKEAFVFGKNHFIYSVYSSNN